jgi:hypothetical protein
MCTDKELKLQKSDCQIKDANGKNFKTYGTAQMKILFLLKHSIFGMVTGINNCDSGGF